MFEPTDVLCALLPYLALALAVATFAAGASVCEAVVRGAIWWGLAAAAALEALGLIGEIGRPGLVACWLAFLGVFAWLRLGQGFRAWRVPDATWRTNVIGLACIAALGLISIAVLLTGLCAAPNNWDSLTYHLPRIEHWIQQRSLDDFPTANLREIVSNPLGEMLIAHFRILSGSERLDSQVQFLAFVGCFVCAASIARRLGAPARGALLAAMLAATLPMAVLQGSSTQNDLVVSFFLMAAVERLLAWRASGPPLAAVEFAIGLGLALLTKGTAYLFAAPFCALAGYFLLASAVKPGHKVVLATAMALVVLAINLGQYARNLEFFGTPLAAPEGIASTDRSPGANVSSLVRNVTSNLATTSPSVNEKIEHAVAWLHALVGRDPNDPATTWKTNRFHLSSLTRHEDTAPNPVHTVLFALFAGLALQRRVGAGLGDARRHQLLIFYFACALLGGLLFCALLRWQVWITRLQLPYFELMAPAVATVMIYVVRGRLAWTATFMALLSFALPCVLDNQTRPVLAHVWLLGNDPSRQSIFETSYWQDVFGQRPAMYATYRAAVDLIKAQPVSAVAFLGGGNTAEYPVWRMLREDPSGRPVRIEHSCHEAEGARRPAFIPDALFVADRAAPERMPCGPWVYGKIAAFVGKDDPDSAVAVYRPLDNSTDVAKGASVPVTVLAKDPWSVFTYPATLGQGIDFRRPMRPEFLDEMAGLGWIEAWGRWSDSRLAPTVTLIFARPLPARLRVELTARAFLGNGHGVTMRVGEATRSFDLSESGIRTVELDFDLPARATRIEIIAPNPRSPASLGLNKDERVLGIGLVSMRFLDRQP